MTIDKDNLKCPYCGGAVEEDPDGELYWDEFNGDYGFVEYKQICPHCFRRFLWSETYTISEVSTRGIDGEEEKGDMRLAEKWIEDHTTESGLRMCPLCEKYPEMTHDERRDLWELRCPCCGDNVTARDQTGCRDMWNAGITPEYVMEIQDSKEE